jgi:hypothetical protein
MSGHRTGPWWPGKLWFLVWHPTAYQKSRRAIIDGKSQFVAKGGPLDSVGQTVGINGVPGWREERGKRERSERQLVLITQ